jgi:hypothetical protein
MRSVVDRNVVMRRMTVVRSVQCWVADRGNVLQSTAAERDLSDFQKVRTDSAASYSFGTVSLYRE